MDNRFLLEYLKELKNLLDVPMTSMNRIAIENKIMAVCKIIDSRAGIIEK